MDFVVAFLATRDTWYIIPIEKLGMRRTIYLYPDGSRWSFGGLFEEYREAWHLLKGESQPGDGSMNIGDISAVAAEVSVFRHELMYLGVKEW